MKESISFFVFGIPKPAGSKRAFALKKAGVFTGRVVVTDDCLKSKDWKTDVQQAAMRLPNSAVSIRPLWLYLLFTFPRPKSHYRTGKNGHLLKDDAPRYPAGKPDTTKLIRGVEDALTGLLWKDDSQIVTQKAKKRYGDTPGVYIEITEEDE